MRELGFNLSREFGGNHGIAVQSLMESITGNTRSPLTLLLCAVSLLLLIACANVANLLLVSAIARQRELAVRMALGAGPFRLARQLIAEAIPISAMGGALGLLLAQWIVSGFVALAGNQLPRATTIHIDGHVLAFTAAISIGVGILCSLVPAFLLCRRNLMHAVHEGVPRNGSRSGRKIGNGLVLAEIALAFGLLLVSGLMIKDLILLRDRDSGMRTDHVLAFDLSPDGERYRKESAVMDFYHTFYSRIARAKGIASAGLTSHLPMYRYGVNGEIQIEGGAPWEAKDAPLVEMRWLFGDYLKTIGVPILRGRMLDQRDGKGTHTAVINEVMAEKFWPGKDPLGRRFWLAANDSQWSEVVGVVGDIRSFGLAHDARCEFYRSIDQSPFFDGMTMVLRVDEGDPKSILPTVRQILASVDPTVPLSNAQTLEDVVSASVGSSRLMSALTGLFACLAGLIAMMGIYSVTAYNVRRQRREFGVRIAMGARPVDIVKLVLGGSLLLALAGLILGAFGAWLLTGFLRSMIHDVSPNDSAIFAGTAATVLAIALLASYLPARSAARVDPTGILRNE